MSAYQLAKQQLIDDMVEAEAIEKECIEMLAKAAKALETARARRLVVERAYDNYVDPRYSHFDLNTWADELLGSGPRKTDLTDDEILEHWTKSLFGNLPPGTSPKQFVQCQYSIGSPNCKKLIEENYSSFLTGY